jgi:hypothetical protein
MGLFTKSVPVGVLRGLRALNKFNIIVSGTKAELSALGLRETAGIRLACFDRVPRASPSRHNAQCSALVGSDSVNEDDDLDVKEGLKN